ncbi:hypothetical protein C0995_013258 [Termitomyces sp. Mi166|nr:hypothetical protein C0995_013258 [Termitomyces sp. Mi166\
MNDRRNSDPILDSTSFHASSHRASGSSQSSSTGRRYQDGSSRSSGRHSTYEDLAKSLKQQLLVANKRLKGQELRAVDNEQQILALAKQLKLVGDAHIAAAQEAAKASEELEYALEFNSETGTLIYNRLYKIQLQNAHQEIRRAQEIIDKVDQERYDAEKAAAEARSMTRRYQRHLLMIKAMEEGRKLGIQEGIEQGRALTLRERDEYEDADVEGSANEYLDNASAEYPESLFLASNEEIVVHAPQPLNMEPVAQQPPEPIPVPPPEPVQHIPAMRPRSLRSPSPSAIYQLTSIPPDGYIPTIDPDNVIRMPPPHELAKPPPTPEKPASPRLPEILQEEPRPSSRSHRRRQSNSSFVSASTFSSAASPLGRAAPLSAIPEVQSPYASPDQASDGHTLRHQPSRISSHRSNSVNPEQGGGTGPQPAQNTSIHRRLSISSNISGSLRPSNLNQEDRRKSTASSSAPGITIVPPSRPLSSGTLQSQHIALNDPSRKEGIADVFRPSSMVTQLFGDRVIGQPGPSSSGAVDHSHRTPEVLPIPMPGTYRDPADPTSSREHLRPGSSTGHRVVDNDTTSVRSGDTLTTPQQRRRSHIPRRSLESLATHSFESHNNIAGWEDAARVAGSHVPVSH